MNLKTFHYSVLKYCPSHALGEQVNIAILFLFKEEGTVKFIFPTALSRLNALFPFVNVGLLKGYLQYFGKKIQVLSSNKELVELLSPKELIEDHILIPDSNSLYFGDIKTAKYNTIEQVIKHYYNSYFDTYHTTHNNEKHNDQYLIKTFSDKLHQNKKVEALVKRAVPVSNRGGITTTFDFAWQNGHVNLIKPLSFDLVKKSSIQEKSVKWFGYVTQLEETAKSENLIFNFLVAKPTNKELYKSYEEAIAILEHKKGLVELIFENNLDNYLEEAENSIQPLEKMQFHS